MHAYGMGKSRVLNELYLLNYRAATEVEIPPVMFADVSVCGSIPPQNSYWHSIMLL